MVCLWPVIPLKTLNLANRSIGTDSKSFPAGGYHSRVTVQRSAAAPVLLCRTSVRGFLLLLVGWLVLLLVLFVLLLLLVHSRLFV